MSAAELSELGRWALYYATEWKLPVFPLTPATKLPMAGTHGFKEATTNAHIIRAWWEMHPNANVAAPTGTASHCIGLDADPQHGADVSALHLPATLPATTPHGGTPSYCRQPDGVRIPSSAGRLGSGLDIRGEGDYLVLPPSRLDDGSPPYCWRDQHAEVAEFPLDLVPLLVSAPSVPSANGPMRPALALWDYALASTRHIFGAKLGDAVADTLLAALQAAGATGLTRTEISQLFGRHRSAADLARSLGQLLALGLVMRSVEETEGCAAERWCVRAGD